MDLFRGTIRGNRLAACPQMSRCFSRSLGADGLPPCSQDLQLTTNCISTELSLFPRLPCQFKIHFAISEVKRVFSNFYFLPIRKLTDKLLNYFSASPCMQLLNTSIQQQNVQPARGMANLKAIAIRLKSVKNIQKITQSMKMVSAAKYARAERDLKVS